MRSLISDHRALALILLAFVVLASLYSFTTPLFETPDEREHFAFEQSVARGNGLPVQSVERAAHLAKQEGSQPPLYYLAAAALTFWIDTSDFPALAWENPHYGFNVPGIVNDNKNLFIHTSRENFPYSGAVLAIHLARLLSVLMGTLAIAFVYLLGLEFFAQNKTLAASAAAVAAFTPQFLFISGAVSNDSAMVALAAYALWRMARTLRVAPTRREWFFIGVICGLAALTKVSGLALIALAGFLVVYHAWRTRQEIRDWGSEIVICFSLLTFAFLLIAGWWYARNLLLYGEFTGTEMMLGIFGGRTTPMTWELFNAQAAEVRETFWLGFGWGNIRAQPIVYVALEIFSAFTGIGTIVGFVRQREKRIYIFLATIWVLLVFAALIRWMFVTQAPHGRLAFPALPTLAGLFVFGLMQVVPSRWQLNAARGLAVAFFSFAFFALFAILAPAYAFPAWLTETDAQKIANRLDINYDGKMKLMGYEISPRRAAPGDSLDLTLYWQSLAPMDDDYSIGLHLLDAKQQVISTRVSYPGHGMLPTRLWQPGQMLRDAYWLPIPSDVAAPALAQIQVTLYSRATRRDLPARDAKGQTLTPFIGRLRIAPAQSAPAKPQRVANFLFDDRIALIGYDIRASGKMTLYWQPRAAIPDDYTVFIHVLDGNGQVIAQRDGQPQSGNAPTSLWEKDEVIADSYALDAPEARRVRVGLYHAETGERLEIRDSAGNVVGDSVVLELRTDK